MGAIHRKAGDKMDNLDFSDFDINFNDEQEQEKPEKHYSHKRRTVVLKRMTNEVYRRAFSETRLLDIVDELKEGYAYNFITEGDVDALSYLKLILRHQPKLKYVLISTWCMAFEDIYQIEEWLEEGAIEKMDIYLGRIFQKSYQYEKMMIERIMTKYNGRVVIFRNHSKVIAGYGDQFHFGLQTSANVNRNPCTENACLTITKEIFDFYKEYYDGLKSIEE